MIETKKTQGFASMDPQRVREIASQGGRAAHEKGTAFRWTSEAARAASIKSHVNRKARSTGAANTVGFARTDAQSAT